MTNARSARSPRQRDRQRASPTSSIARVLDLPLALDFEAMVARGIELTQRLSGDEWTDYNEHDPGVTLLQALCYALTDVAYRAGHSEADVLLGAATDRDVAARAQAIITGLEALPSAPLTTDDYRALLYAKVVGLQNAWFFPGPHPEGLVRVLVERVPLPPKLTDTDENNTTVCAHAARLLHAYRGLGDDFEWPTPVPLLEIQLCGTIDIGHEETPDDVIANIVHDVQQALVRAPMVIAADQLLRDGATPDEVFEGPHQGGGPVRFPATTWYEQLPPPARILRAVRRAAGVRRVTDLRLRVGLIDAPHADVAAERQEYRISRDGARWKRVIDDDAVTPLPREEWARPRRRRWMPRVSVGWTPACSLNVRRAGLTVTVTPDRVEKGLRHIRERWHQTEAYAITRLETQEYARLPDARNRQLAQYRSFRHLLPTLFGVGAGGVPDGGSWRSDVLPDEGPGRALAWRQEQAHHLATYLRPFEQLIADQLAQLAGAATHWSVSAGALSPASLFTYATQSLAGDPLHANDMLALRTQTHTPEPVSADAGMRARDTMRREQVLDHLLARYGESFDNVTLTSLDQTRGEHSTRLAHKQSMLEGLVATDGASWGRDRGLGIDYRFGALHHVPCRSVDGASATSYRVMPEPTAMERRVQALADTDRIYIVEPLLLRPRGRALRVEFSHTSTLRAWLYGSRDALRAYARDVTEWDAEAEAGVLRALEQRGRGRVALPLGPDGLLLLDPVIDNASDVRRVVEAFGPARPQGVAIRSERPRVSPFALTVVHARQAHATADEALVLLDRTVRANCPAHLVPRMIELDATDMHEFERLYSVWVSAWQPRKASEVLSGAGAPADSLTPQPRTPTTPNPPVVAAELSASALVEVDAAAAQLRRFLLRRDARTLSAVVRD